MAKKQAKPKFFHNELKIGAQKQVLKDDIALSAAIFGDEKCKTCRAVKRGKLLGCHVHRFAP